MEIGVLVTLWLGIGVAVVCGCMACVGVCVKNARDPGRDAGQVRDTLARPGSRTPQGSSYDVYTRRGVLRCYWPGDRLPASNNPAAVDAPPNSS